MTWDPQGSRRRSVPLGPCPDVDSCGPSKCRRLGTTESAAQCPGASWPSLTGAGLQGCPCWFPGPLVRPRLSFCQFMARSALESREAVLGGMAMAPHSGQRALSLPLRDSVLLPKRPSFHPRAASTASLSPQRGRGFSVPGPGPQPLEPEQNLV